VIAELAYLAGALTSVLCAVLLIRTYLATRTSLLLWSSLSFVGLALNNILLFADMFLVPTINLELWRSGTALVAMLLLLFGLIWESK
jgi:hypothetical protein